jgi:hypothetical protein
MIEKGKVRGVRVAEKGKILMMGWRYKDRDG